MWEATAAKTCPALKILIHKVYGWHLRAMALHSMSGRNGYGSQTNYNVMEDNNDDTNDDIITTITQTAAAMTTTRTTCEHILMTPVFVHKREFLFLNSLKGFWGSLAEIS
jgi:hypothetical protein